MYHKLKLYIKRLFCWHKLEYHGVKNGYHTHICSKCNYVVLEREFE